MALVLKDRVKETTTTTGTGSFALAGAVTGYDSFGQIGSGNTTYYAVYLDGGSEWEVGIGTYTSPSTLSRNTILASSNAGSVVTFSAGQKTIWCDYPAGKAVYLSANNVVESTVIGGSSPAAGTFTDLTANDNVTLGFSNTDTIAVNGRITTDLEPNANNAKDIGTNGRNWRDAFFGRTLHTVNLELTGTTSFDGSQGTNGQVLTSAGSGSTPTWTTPTTGTVTSVAATGGTGISIGGSPITGSGTLTITNTAPDQTVSIASGTGISVSGTYPSFTITNTAPDVPFTYTSTYIPFGQGTSTPNQSASLNYTTGTGALRTPAIEASNGLVVNNLTIATSYSIPSGYGASSVGPVTINSGVTITVPSGSRWVVL